MPYLGSEPPVGFASTTKQAFNGDASAVAFTLSRVASVATDLEVFVDNVQQEPTTAYSVSGTTLTFTAAPATGTGNIYVVHRQGGSSSTTIENIATDLSFKSDGTVLKFGADSDITLTHVADTGLNIKNINTGDNKPVILTLQTGETDLAANEVIGKIAFQSPDEGTGTDAILVSAAIQAIAEGNHSSSSNATSLQFMTGASEAATSKMVLSSGGNLTVTGGLTVTGLPITGQATAGRNMVINGAMNVAQRSASVTGLGAADGYFTCDRWHINQGATSAGRFTMSQTADGPDGISANCIKIDCTTADTSIAAGEHLILEQRFEGQNLQRMAKGLAGAKQVNVSFYVKASAAFDFVVELYDADHDRQISKLYSTTTDWVRHEFTIPADVDGGDQPLDDDNASSFLIDFWLHGGSNFTSGTLNTASWANATAANLAAGIDSIFSNTANNFFLTGVQLEVGPVATEFEQELISTTLAKCQRYFFKVEGASGDRVGIGGYVVGASEARFDFVMPVSMRAIPTLSGSGNAQFDAAADSADFAVTDMVIDGAPTGIVTGIGLQIATSNMTAGQSGGLRFRSTGTLTLTAEL